VTCYEAGGFGFHLHRRFEELGIESYMVNPKTGMNGTKA
jgi:transposase